MPLPRRAPVALVLALIVALGAGVAGAPARVSARQPQIATERPAGQTVDFVALDANGSQVVDLQSSEVEVRIADRVRAVRTLRRVAAAPAPTAAGSVRVPPPYGTNDDVAAGRRFVLVIDQESFVAGREQLFRGAIEGLLAELTPSDRTMVAALPFGGVVVPFTSDTIRIRQAAGRVTGQGSRAETGSDLACRTRRFLESLEGLLRERGAQTSPQTLILFTSGLAGPRRDAPAGLMPGMCELVVDQFRSVATAAGAARANVYVMQPADIGMSPSLQRSTIGGVGDRGSDNPLEGIEHFAGVTGGARLSLDATGTASLLRVARESSAYYVAELEPVRDEVFGRSRHLNVRVARRGVTVRVRPEITFTDTARTATTRLAVTDILASTEAVTDLRLRVGGFTVRDADGKLRLGVLVEPADTSAALASAGAILVDGNGRVVTHWHARDATERPLLGAMTAPPGPYRLRAAAIDTAGRPGAAEADIDAGLTQVGELSLGSLLLGVSRGGTTSLQLEFGSELSARASFDIYGGTLGQRLSATLEVARDLDGPAMSAAPLALTRADDTRVVATGVVPLGALAPGDYVVRGVIRLEDGTTGRVVRTLRKVAK
jgi:VWFA-related protein